MQVVEPPNDRGEKMQRSYHGLVLALTFAFAIPAHSQTGNGAPNGPHFELGIIGVSDPKTQPLTSSDRHTIFVGLGSKKEGVTTNIYLTQGPFAVCDGNGFDAAYDCAGNLVASSGAVFQLPCDLLTDTCSGGDSQAYTIWARALGQPGGQATVTTCGTDLTGTVICSTDNVLLVRGHGQQTFKNVTSALTTIDTTLGTVSLFSTGFQNFFWSYDNNGLRLAQVRFYPQ
jgi:hypothetical protein